ncbi:MAG: DUF3160 domain-containing protein [Lachnospiraceae bacterium]|nr:DUF3160 domain-containing protein [Lachnospiraceae bacterium]
MEGHSGNRLIRRVSGIALCGMLVISSAACGMQGPAQQAEVANHSAGQEENGKQENASNDDAKKEETDTQSGQTATAVSSDSARSARPTLLAAGSEDSSAISSPVEAKVPEYSIEPDLSNVVNVEQLWIQDAWKKQLASDGFCVSDNGGREFFEIYEGNRYMMVPNFITVDSLMHSYHLYFAYLMKSIERQELFDRLTRLTDRMLAASEKQRMDMMLSSTLSGVSDDMMKAQERNTVFFAVAKSLLDPSWKPDDGDYALSEESKKKLEKELSMINAADGIDYSPLMGEADVMEDYSQYKPRGYYDTDEKLSRYFRAMMWYGRMNFSRKDSSLDKSAMLMTLAMDEEAYDEWSTIYAVTSFFAGASDDNGICEYRPLIEQAYGRPLKELTGLEVVGDEDGWRRFHDLTATLPAPAINSVPMWDDDGQTDKMEENAGFRFMGQRFSIDAAIFQRLIYSQVLENKKGENRMLPDALDVPAALGSRTAEKILREDLGAMEYQNYEENMTKLRNTIQQSSSDLWNASLYSGWIDTLRPLLTEKGKGYPLFMQGEKWNKKNLESFLGSYTELKHDTVLYSKQVIAEMGGGDEEIMDDRGYVEPEPLVFDRFAKLAQGTGKGLKNLGLLTEDAERDLERLENIGRTLSAIAVKELADEMLTDEEFEFIRCYGGEIEHFWAEAYKEDAKNPQYFSSEEFPAAVVVDVATDPNGSVLQLATDDPAVIYVVVPVDNTLRIARGSVYSFYQFAHPMDDRLTDREWRVMLGIDEDDDGNFHWERENVPDKPAWTMDYRVFYQFD